MADLVGHDRAILFLQKFAVFLILNIARPDGEIGRSRFVILKGL
jgi:hypothetical protein